MKVILLQSALLIGASLLFGVLTKLWHPRAPAWYLQQEPVKEGEISLQGVDELDPASILWIDARVEKRYREGHIPGAVMINMQDTEGQLFENFDRIQVHAGPVIVYCDSQACEASEKIADFLYENTILDPIYVLQGGWPNWTGDGREVSKE